MQRYATWIIVVVLLAFAAAACIVSTRRPVRTRSQPVYVEKHKPAKHKKHKKHQNDQGENNNRD